MILPTLLLHILLVLPVSNTAATDSDSAAEWFRTELTNSASKRDEALRNFKAMAIGSITGYTGDTKETYEYAFDAEFFVKGSSKLAHFRYDPRKRRPKIGIALVRCLTELLWFRLEKESSDQAFVLREISRVPRRKPASLVAKMAHDLDDYVFATSSLYGGTTVLELLNDPEAKIRSVARKPGDGQDVVVTFDLASSVSCPTFESAILTFVPGWDWLMRECLITVKSSPGDTTTIRSSIAIDDWPTAKLLFPRSVEHVGHTRTANGTEFHRKETVQFTDLQLGIVSDSNFKLSAFGLPDIPLDPEKRYYPFDSWVFWIFALVGTGSAAILWHKCRHAARS